MLTLLEEFGKTFAEFFLIRKSYWERGSPSALTSVSSCSLISAVSAPFSRLAGVTSSRILTLWSRQRAPPLKQCQWSRTLDGQGMSPEWRTIDCPIWRTIHRLQRERERKNITTNPSPHTRQILERAVTPGATRSS